MRITSTNLRTSVRVMRVLCPLVCIAAIVVGTLAFRHEIYWAVVVNAICATVTANLTWIEWFRFKI